MKIERVWQKYHANHSKVVSCVADFIVGFYEITRLHRTLGNLLLDASAHTLTSQPSMDLSKITSLQSTSNTASALRSAEHWQEANYVGVNLVVLCSTQNAIEGCA